MKSTQKDIERIVDFFNASGVQNRRIAVDLTPEELHKVMGIRVFDNDYPDEIRYRNQIIYCRDKT